MYITMWEREKVGECVCVCAWQRGLERKRNEDIYARFKGENEKVKCEEQIEGNSLG